MPLYEYQCDACGHRFEVIHQRFSDPPAEACPKCGGKVRKLQSSPAIQFKGSGWYITDYARAGKTDGGSAEGKPDAGSTPSASKAESKSESTGESKTETKSESKKESTSETKPSGSTPPSTS